MQTPVPRIPETAPRGRGRRTVLGLALCLAVAGCEAPAPREPAGAGPVRARESMPLRPWLTISSARMLSAVGPLGEPAPGAADRFVRLLRPVAAAGRHNDLYVLDAGLGALLRHDLALGTFARVPGVAPRAGVRLAVLGDLSLLVLDQASRQVLQITRGGRVVRAYGAGDLLGRPVDLAVDEAHGVFYVVDSAANRIVVMRIAGGASHTIVPQRDGRDVAAGISAIAVGADALYAVDRLARQILRLAPDGRIVETSGHADLRAPEAIAVDRHGRVYVSDAGDNTLKVFSGQELVASYPAARLGVQRVGDLSLADPMLVLVDPDAGQVQLLRIVPPSAQLRAPAPEAR